MNDPDESLPQDAGECLTRRPKESVWPRQNDRFDSLVPCLGRQLAVVKQDEQSLDAMRLQSAHDTENVSFDAAK
jgi:hypothetical protein